MQTITPVQGADGEITHFIAIKADLTEQRNLEEQFRQAHRLEAVGQLAGGIAHEFNNLLQALLSMATVLRLRATGTAFAKIGADIETHVLRGAGLTRQLLQFSRRKPLEVARLDLGELVRREGVLLRRLIPENIRLVVDTAPGRWLEGDAGQLQQVLMNLVINARDAMPDGGTLTVRTSSAGGELTLEVADTGRGMDEATKLRIFEPFFTTKEAGKGTGLGLAVVLGIVQQHGGRIEVETEPGSGTRFRIVLSAAGEAGQEEIQPSALEAGVEQVRGMRVLLVEDEEGVREGVQALLEMLGYEVIAVGSGEEAVALSPMLRPELLLSDVTLPGITGSVVVQKLRERWPSLKVVLMSGYLPDDLPLDPGGVHFLQKPFGIDNLALALRAATEDLAAPPAR